MQLRDPVIHQSLQDFTFINPSKVLKMSIISLQGCIFHEKAIRFPAITS